jgi:peptidoglycan/xylan/chitin deacetylase (PgdA/CDA1 family)
MFRKSWGRLLFAVVVSFAFAWPSPAKAAPPNFKPNKVLLVIGDQWTDPNSQIIDGPNGEGPVVSYVKQVTVGGRSGIPFWHLAALLKLWGIPFDILRLDQAELYIDYFLDNDNKPAYGAIIWDVDRDAVPARHYNVVSRAVTEYGISLIALYNAIKQPEIQNLLGIEWPLEYYKSGGDHLNITGDHFITRKFQRETFPPPGRDGQTPKPLVSPVDSYVLASQGDGAAITYRQVSKGTSAIWIGGDPNTALHRYPVLARIIRRAIVQAVGYSVYKTFPNTVYFRMDDPSATAMYENWHFPALSETEIKVWIVEPLRKKDALLSVNMNPGRVRADKKMIEPTWRGVHTDELGDRHDLDSNARGWKAGIDAGVIEVQNHGWTHMNANLHPYWTADLSFKLQGRWGSEFYDRVRGKEVPGTVQLIHMKRSHEALVNQWGKRPLYFRAGQGAYSVSYPNHTARWARRAGYGMMRPFWLGDDYIINLKPFLFRPRDGDENFAIPDERPLEVGSHDFDVYKDHDFVKKVLDRYLPANRFIGQNEMIAYLWAETAAGPGAKIEFNYHPVFCAFFNENESSWLLHLSDQTREILAGSKGELVVDGVARRLNGAEYFKEIIEIKIPKGAGSHSWEIR